MKKYFYCYSYPFKEFLLSKGKRFITSGIHPKTHKKFWIFEEINKEELDCIKTEWSLMKN